MKLSEIYFKKMFSHLCENDTCTDIDRYGTICNLEGKIEILKIMSASIRMNDKDTKILDQGISDLINTLTTIKSLLKI